MKKLVETFKGKTYQIKVHLEGFSHIKVVIMELKRPNWKCFRYSYIGTKYRLINDFDTIEDAVQDAFVEQLAEIELEAKQEEKISNFFEK